MSLKAFSHPWCNTSHLCTGSNWSCCSPLPSKDLGDFQGQAQCLISFQSPNGNLMLYNIFLLGFLIAVLLIHVPKGRGSGFFTALVLVLRTVPDSWQALNKYSLNEWIDGQMARWMGKWLVG